MDIQNRAQIESRLDKNKNTVFLLPDAHPGKYLFFFAAALQLVASTLSALGYSDRLAAGWFTGMFSWIVWFVFMFVIISPRTTAFSERFGNLLKRGANIILICVIFMAIGEFWVIFAFLPAHIDSAPDSHFIRSMEQMRRGLYYNDAPALIQQAAENLLEGKNPYEVSNIAQALAEYGAQAYDRVTPLRVGKFADVFPYPADAEIKQLVNDAVRNPSRPVSELESHVSYPAGSFLLAVPFIALGVNDIRVVYIIFTFAALAYAMWRIPARNQLLFFAFLLVSLELWNSLAIRENGILTFAFLLVAWITLGKNNWISAVAMGLAVATKQTAWFFLPFYLMILYRRSGWKPIGVTTGIIAAIFFVTNIYFFAADPVLWYNSVVSPMADPVFPLGVGLVAFVTTGVVDIQSSLPFTIMEFAAFAGAVAWYWRYGAKHPNTALILAIIPMFFAWRSLWNYFFYVSVIILATMLINENEEQIKT